MGIVKTPNSNGTCQWQTGSPWHILSLYSFFNLFCATLPQSQLHGKGLTGLKGLRWAGTDWNMAWLYHEMQPRSCIWVLGAAPVFSQRSMQQPLSSHADVEVKALSLYSCWCSGLLGRCFVRHCSSDCVCITFPSSFSQPWRLTTLKTWEYGIPY